MTELREGDRVYYLSRPARTGTVRITGTRTNGCLRSGHCIHVELDEPELDRGKSVSFVQSSPALWRKL